MVESLRWMVLADVGAELWDTLRKLLSPSSSRNATAPSGA
jgi:hypothetical protein